MSGRDHSRFPNAAAEMLAVAMIGAALLGPAAAAEATSLSVLQAQSEAGAPSGTVNPEELSKLLPLLLTSSERKQLATELEASIRHGDLKAAENRLNAAIELGTLAILLVDRVHDPDLLPILQTLGIRGSDDPSSPDRTAAPAMPPLCNASDASSGSSNLLELQEALEHERAQGSAALQELAFLTQNYRSLTARLESDSASATSKISDLRTALQREQERSDAATRQLASLQEEHRALQDLLARNTDRTKSMATELEAMVQQERDRGNDAVRQLASAQDALGSLQALKEKDHASDLSRITELQEALAREKVRGDAVARELADALETIDELRVNQEARELSDAQARHASAPEDHAAQTPQDLQAVAAIIPPPNSGPPAQRVASALPLTELGVIEVKPTREETQPSPAASAEQAKAVAISASSTGKAEPSAAPAKTEDRLVTRADELFRKGDVSGARLLLERAMETGNAQAAFRLAETFDPHVLSKMGAFGIRGDAAKARELYAKARALGIAQAGERMEALK